MLFDERFGSVGFRVLDFGFIMMFNVRNYLYVHTCIHSVKPPIFLKLYTTKIITLFIKLIIIH